MSETLQFDLVVLGSGPGGYVAAIRAAQLGFKTALVEKDKTLGGTCLNVGCIPSKALLHSTEMYHFTGHGAADHGIDLTNLSVDIGKLMERKNRTVSQLCGGVAQLMKANKVTVVQGLGMLEGQGKVRVSGNTGESLLEAKHIVIATGSVPVELPFFPSTAKPWSAAPRPLPSIKFPSALSSSEPVPLASNSAPSGRGLGAQVDVVEFLPVIAPTFDKDVSKMAERLFKKQGLNFHLGTV